jgi:hypothetical protein
MRRTLPYLLAFVIIFGLAAYLYSTGEKVFGVGFGLVVSILMGVVALEQPRRSVHVRPTSPDRTTGDSPTASHGSNVELVAIQAKLTELALEINKLTATSVKTPDDAPLRKAVETLASELSSREKEASRHQDLLVQRDQKRLLARIASIRETAEFMRRAVTAGKMDVNEALNQMMLELEAAIGDLGLEVYQIAPGTRISELPAAAFIALTAESAPDPSQAGTVKEAMSDALFIQDPAGRRAYISPAKLKLYRI